MEYTINKLSKLAGVSTRTLRYYDGIGLLKPLRINPSGYRVYGSEEVKRLQQIMFYRELGVELDCIKSIIDSPSFDALNALKEHREKLVGRRAQLDLLILNVEKSICESEGRITMSDNEKFEGFKQKALEENEKKYGKEIREKYGDEKVEKSNKIYSGMTKEQYEKTESLGKEIIDTLLLAFETGDPSGEAAQKAADLHRQWLSFFWGEYSKEAHAGVAQMYVEDPRFTEYYDKFKPGLAKFLRDAVFVYTGK